MFNLKKQKVAQVMPYEKYLRENPLGPTGEGEPVITEKKLPHRDGNPNSITEANIQEAHTSKENSSIIERKLNNTDSDLVVHRSKNSLLNVPPINALVEKIRQKEMEQVWHTKKDSHWSMEDDKAQNGELPQWPKSKLQHDKIVLNNDPRRFNSLESMPTSTNAAENVKNRSKSNKIEQLVSTITTAGMDRLTYAIKTGGTIDYDSKIVSILKIADAEKRELTEEERKQIVQYKIDRTRQYAKNN